MADSTKGGQATSLRQENFDPRVTTLDQYIDMYVKKAGSDKNWGNIIRKNDVLKPYLNKPVMDLFDPVNPSQTGSVLADAQNVSTNPANLQSKIRTIENSGIFDKLKILSVREGVDQSADYIRLSDSVEKLKTRGNRATFKYQYNPTKVGELVENLVAHVDKFPEDKPIANAILLNLETGSRPSLMLGLVKTDFVGNKVTPEVQRQGYTGSDGLLIPADRAGVKASTGREGRPYNTPISKRATTILQDQDQYNTTGPLSNSADPMKFFQVSDKDGVRQMSLDDVKRVLSTTSPKGIILEITDRGLIESSKPLLPQDLRKVQIQAMNMAGIPIDKQAMLLSRDVGTGAAQDIYIGGAGSYNQPAVDDLNKASKLMWGQYTQKVEGGIEAINDNKYLSPSTFVFDKPKPNFEVYEAAQPADVPIRIPVRSTPVEYTGDVPISDGEKSVKVDTSGTAASGEFSADGKKGWIPSVYEAMKKRGLLGLGAGVAGVGILTNPGETLADVGIGLAGKAAGLAGGPPAVVSGVVLGSKEAGAGSDQPSEQPATQQQLMTQTYTLEQEIPSMKEKRDQLGRENLLSAGFMTRQRNQLEGEENAGQ